MIHSAPFAERVRGVFKATPRGVVGLVDDLLVLCQTHQLRISFENGHCFVRPFGSDSLESIEVPRPKSVFRAVLARIAALCNERQPRSVTPYRGEGVVDVPMATSENGISPSTCYVEFTNTLSDQRLEVRFSKSSLTDGRRLADSEVRGVFSGDIHEPSGSAATDPMTDTRN